jgi:periodic tryptophan protein 1
MSMITASAWVPRGSAAAYPTKYDVDEHELARISKLAKLQLEDAKDDLDDVNKGHKSEEAMEESSGAEGDGVVLPRSHG